MTYDTINDARTIAGNAEENTSAENGTSMEKSLGAGVTIRPKEERGGRGAFAPGDVIAGRYVVEKVLGEGGMGIVYQCLDKVGGVSVAVKCLPPKVSRNADEMDDIRANYRLVSDLNHPNIAGARTLELDESTGDYYLVMDLVRGMSLKRWMKRNPQATMEAKLAILRQVAAALDYAHAQKVIHRDVKPENVMVDDEGGVKVLDFGLAAQIRSSQSRTSTTVTSKGGTPGYKSPEQWLGRPQREPADVYSFGVLAYWMLSGYLPFDGDDPVVLGHAVLSAPVEPVVEIPAHMNAALVKALAKQPDGRFASCGEVVDALEGKNFSRVEYVERVESGGNGRARSPSGPESVGSRVPRDLTGGPRPVAALKGWLAVAALVLVVAGGVMLHGHRQRQQDEARRQARIVAEQKAEAERLVAERKAQEAAARRQADEERKVREEAERRRKAEEEARLAAERRAKDAATEIRIEAKVQHGKVARISDGDGFKARKDVLEDVFIRAEAFYDEKARRWAEAGALYKDYVEQSKSVVTLDGERQQAVAKRSAAQAAFRNAEAEGAKTYAKDSWNGAVKTWNEAAAEFKRMEFASAAVTFAKAVREFEGSVDEVREKKRAEEEILAEEKRMAEAREAERRRQEEIARQAEARRRAEAKRASAERERQRAAADNGHAKVQLWAGGPYWATTNIGANKPEEYGLYFWWGDTSGHAPSSGFLGRLYFDPAFDGNSYTYNKTRSELQSAGWLTGSGILSSKHDAAHVRWGGAWRMPTKQELDDLCSKCDWRWTSINGVRGYVVCGRGAYASNSIFLPCAGYGDGTSLRDAGSDGNYWSSVPTSGYSACSWCLCFDSRYLNTIGGYGRWRGQSIRPVQGFDRWLTK